MKLSVLDYSLNLNGYFVCVRIVVLIVIALMSGNKVRLLGVIQG